MRGFILGVSTTLMFVTLVGAMWPSTGGTTAPGIVIEDGAGNALGTAANPIACQ